MFNTPPSKKMVNTRSTSKQQQNTGMPPPASTTKDENKMEKSCAGSIVKQLSKTDKPPSQSSRHSAKHKKSSSSSIQAQKKKLQLEAAKAKAKIQMDLIEKQLEADIADLDEEYSPPLEISEPDKESDVKRWVERSQQELELQHATMMDEKKGKPHTSGYPDTDGTVQQLVSALKDVVTSSTFKQNTHLLSRLSTPRDLPIFGGNPMDWLPFKQAYEESTEVCTFTEKENLWRLRKCLRGAAHEAVSALLISATSPSIVMSTLQLQFGNPDVILSHIITDIKKMCSLPPDYCREIVPFSIKVKNYVAAVRALGREEYLQGVEVATIVLSKLPTTLISKWADYSYPLITVASPRPRLDLLSDFLTEEAMKISTCSATLLQHKPDIFKRKYYDKVNNVQSVLKLDEQCEQKCQFCRTNNHKLTECKKFKKSLRKDRWQHVKRFGICYKCLLARHSRETCPASCCDVNNCGQSHHRLLHYVPRQDTSATVSEVQSDIPSETVTHININSSVLLKVVPINIHGPNGIVSATALLDNGSTVSLISASLASRVGLNGRRECLRVRGAWDNTELVCDAQLVNMTLCGANSDNEPELFTINARVVNELNLPKQNLSVVNWKNFKHLHNVSQKLCAEQAKPQVLIGQDNYHLLLPLETKMGRLNEPCATRTPLGWCLHGRVPGGSSDPARHSTLFVTSDVTETERILQEIHEEVRCSFTMESMGVSAKPRQNSEDIRAENILENTSALIDGQWHVGLPWKDEKSMMPNSYPTAICRLKGVEQKMKKNKDFEQRYKERIYHLLENNYAKKLSESAVTPKTWYLPHFGVDNPNKKKMRLVFDAAAKTNSVCLNDYLLKGPDLLTSLFGIMLRFRENPVAVTGDIKDMFLRVKIRPEDQNAFRFVYRDEPEGPIDTYIMTSLIFGANCSPFIAQFVKNKNAQQYKSTMPAATSAICTQHYMDDYIDSLPDEKTAIQLVHDVMSIHKKGGFEIRNWTSNSKAVLNSLPKESLGATAVNFKIGQQYEGERTLGLIWDPREDSLRFDVSFKRIPAGLINGTQRPTKREMLRVIMSIFDIYGFLSPYTIIGKIILQDTWQLKISWDEHVNDIINDKWVKWIKLLQTLRNVRLPRCYHSATAPARTSETENKPVLSVNQSHAQRGAPVNNALPTITTGYTCLQLHTFCDASSKAMCSTAFWRWLENDCVRVAFVTSRCRVAPVKPVSVPRLELQAAVLAARLAETITKEHKMKVERKYFWCDSSTVLTWIRNDARNYKQYVAHRLGEIDELTTKEEWRYVPTKLNVADIATRESFDCSILEKEWMHGPAFLYSDETQWPRDFLHLQPEIKEKQLDVECINTVQTVKRDIDLPVPDATRFSSWLRLLRAVSIVLKFIQKCKKITCVFDNTMERAEVLILKQSQAQSFENELRDIQRNKCVHKTSKLLTLSPYLDEDGVMRVDGRIGAAAGVQPETKNPIILDGKSHIARLIIKYYHHYYAHGNQETVVNEVKQKYWITRLRPVTKTVTSQCMLCRIRRSKPEIPRMGDLPGARLAHHQRPFTYCGVDLFGPMEVTVGRHREKRYGVLFTCLTVRAIHIEIASFLNSDSMIMALRRMATRRFWPKYLYSDNGTNLRGADKELKKSIQDLDQEKLNTEALIHGTKWIFIPPASPHWGGAWERQIKSVKRCLKVILNERAPKVETLCTLLAEIENIVNSRPLTHVSVDPTSLETLTPNHFLVGSSSGLPTIGQFDDSDLFLRKQWRISQRLADMYWRRWLKEILPDMLPRRKWQGEQRKLQVGELVLVVDPDGPRNLWPRGLVQEIVPGKDCRVRMVKIKTKSGVIVRSAIRVARIPVDDE